MVSLAKKTFRFARWQAAKAWLGLWPNVDTIGVAGSVGKTTAKEVIAAILEQQFRTVKTAANWDPIFNIPITSFRTYGACKFVAELGVDGVGQMDKYLSLVHPRIGVLTRLTLEHTDSDHFGSLEKAIAEEIKLLKSLPPYGWAILNGDDQEVRKAAKTTKAHVLFYGFKPDNDLRVTSFKQEASGSKAVCTIAVAYDTGEREFTTNLLGKQNALCTCAGVSVGIVMGISFDEIQEGLSRVQPLKGRLAPKSGKWGLVIDDSYNASPAAVEAAINVLVDLDPQNGVLVLGDMLELGQYSKEAHFNIGRYARRKGVNALAVYGRFSQDIARGFGSGNRILVARDHEEITEWITNIGEGVILVKGSRSMHMEKVVDALTG